LIQVTNESICFTGREKFQPVDTADSQSHNNTICRSNSHSF